MFDRKTIEKNILNEYAKSRLNAEQKVELTILKARQNAAFDKNYLLVKDLEFKIAEKKYKNEDIKILEEELKLAKIKTNSIAKKLGLKASDYKPKYTCDMCKDTGFVGNDKCSCFKQKINEQLITASGLELSKLNTFDDLNLDLVQTEEQKVQLLQIKNVLSNFSNKFPHSNYNCIVLSGKTGVGKTFLLECTTSEIMKKGFTANFLTAFQMNNQFLKYHTCFDANKQSYLNLLLEPDVLVIDDLGTELTNAFTNTRLYSCINERYLKKKATIISTNLSLSQFSELYSERIFSRITGYYTLLKLIGDDIRINRQLDNSSLL